MMNKPENALSLGTVSKPRTKLMVAAIVTEYRVDSHADVIVGKILEGWNQDGDVGPDLHLASLYTDQVPKNDTSRELARKYNFPIVPSIEEAITLGSGEVAVAGVLSIGEHGDYPHTPDTNQDMYPRRRFFDEIVATLTKYETAVPVFSDKHLGYAWADAEHMVKTARERKIPLMAGSSIPLAWRVPPLTIPMGSEITEAVGLGYGPLEAYGFHALEGLQCMIERRKGGETGVASVQAVKGEAIWQAAETGRWSPELLDVVVGSEGASKKLSPDAVIYLIEYRDGLKAAVAMETGLTRKFAMAARLKDHDEPMVTCFKLQDGKPYEHFAYLLRAIEHMIHTGKPAYPAERTLLVTGILDSVMHSLARDNELMKTPHLSVVYEPVDWPFAEGVPPPSR